MLLQVQSNFFSSTSMTKYMIDKRSLPSSGRYQILQKESQSQRPNFFLYHHHRHVPPFAARVFSRDQIKVSLLSSTLFTIKKNIFTLKSNQNENDDETGKSRPNTANQEEKRGERRRNGYSNVNRNKNSNYQIEIEYFRKPLK